MIFATCKEGLQEYSILKDQHIYSWEYEQLDKRGIRIGVKSPLSGNDVSFVKRSKPFFRCEAPKDFSCTLNRKSKPKKCSGCQYYSEIIRGPHFRSQNGQEVPCTLIQSKIYRFFTNQYKTMFGGSISAFGFSGKIKSISPFKVKDDYYANVSINMKNGDHIIPLILNGRVESQQYIEDELYMLLTNKCKILPIIIKESFELNNRIQRAIHEVKELTEESILMLDEYMNIYLADFVIKDGTKTIGTKFFRPRKKVFFNEIDNILTPKDSRTSYPLVCPRCGNLLQLKKGLYGSFYGCENYPFCSYTTNIDIGKGWDYLPITIKKEKTKDAINEYN